MYRKAQLARQLTGLELEVMLVLWSHGCGSVRLVKEDLRKSRAYNTIQTVLNILEKKGRVRRTLKGRAYEYVPVLSYEKSIGNALKDVVDRMFQGSTEKLIVTLVQSRLLSAERLGELAEQINQLMDLQRLSSRMARGAAPKTWIKFQKNHPPGP